MITDLHLLRPWWCLAVIPLLVLFIMLWRQQPVLEAWAKICDKHLLEHLVQSKSKGRRRSSLLCLFLSGFFMIVSSTGPSWVKLPVATYKPIQPRVLVLDMSENMLQKDLSPNRLTRAKFKLHDVFAHKGIGQFGLVVFTGEPFVVSPLTDDGQTISSLLPMLTSDIMPVAGQKLDGALLEASNLIKQAGYEYGQILVLTADAPASTAIAEAKKLAAKGIYSSIMPMIADKKVNPLFQTFANAGGGQLVLYSADSSDLQTWLTQKGRQEELALSKQDDIPLWRDEGRWFLIPALIFLVPVFRRGWLQKVAV